MRLIKGRDGVGSIYDHFGFLGTGVANGKPIDDTVGIIHPKGNVIFTLFRLKQVILTKQFPSNETFWARLFAFEQGKTADGIMVFNASANSGFIQFAIGLEKRIRLGDAKGKKVDVFSHGFIGNFAVKVFGIDSV
jgi:hypothetical protein